MKTFPLLLSLLCIPLLTLSAQTDAGQTVAGIKTDSDPLTVENGLEEHVTVRAGKVAVSIPATEALHIADWLKRAEDGAYEESRVIKVTRSGDEVMVRLTPPDGPTREVKTTPEGAGQLANALASASQNVSPQSQT